MSEGTENHHNVHILRKCLLDSLNEPPEINKCGLNQQDDSNEPALVLASYDENQFKEGNECLKVLEVHANQEMHMNSNYDIAIEGMKNLMITDTKSFASFHNPMPTDENVAALLKESNECLKVLEVRANQEMHMNSNYGIAIEGMKNLMITDTKSFASFQNPLPTDENVAALLKESFQMMPKIQLYQPETENISSSAEYSPQMQIKNKFLADENGMVCIGPNGTLVSRRTLESINWSLTSAAVTRKILAEIFGRETLAVHNLTGKPSPAFIDCNKPVKRQLDSIIVADIIHLMGEQKGLTPKEVRNAITTKCADENKMLRLKEKRRQRIAARNMISGPYF